jgi:hypothetical protein
MQADVMPHTPLKPEGTEPSLHEGTSGLPPYPSVLCNLGKKKSPVDTKNGKVFRDKLEISKEATA